jgi:hypothetical protein
MRRVSESVLKGDHGCKAGDAGAIAAALSVSGRFRVMGGSSAWTADAITQITITVAAVLLWAIISSCNGIGDEQPDIHIAERTGLAVPASLMSSKRARFPS